MPDGSHHEWFRIQMKDATDAREPTAADVYIYDTIGEDWFGEGVSAKSFAAQLSDLDVDQINLFLNSPGGAAWDGLAIMNALRRHKATVNVTVDALAASAASVIAMAGDHITMNRGAELMIHDASGWAMGNAQDMRDTADVLDKLSNSYADAYAARAGGDRGVWRDRMTAETWFTAEEAVLAGLADEWVDAPAAAARFDQARARFRHHSRADAPAPVMQLAKLPAPEPEELPNKEGVAMNDDILVEGLRDRLGVTDAGMDAAGLLALLDKKLSAQFEPPAGTVLVDKVLYDGMQADVKAARAALDEQRSERLDQVVATAVKEGRIAPASVAGWREALDDNEERTARMLDLLPKNSAVPVAEIGLADGPEASAEEQLYEQIYGKKEA